jgi:hypothetical protein
MHEGARFGFLDLQDKPGAYSGLLTTRVARRSNPGLNWIRTSLPLAAPLAPAAGASVSQFQSAPHLAATTSYRPRSFLTSAEPSQPVAAKALPALH